NFGTFSGYIESKLGQGSLKIFPYVIAGIFVTPLVGYSFVTKLLSDVHLKSKMASLTRTRFFKNLPTIVSLVLFVLTVVMASQSLREAFFAGDFYLINKR